MPLGPNYLPSYAGGVLAGLKELGPKLIGKDPTQIKVINRFMDYELKGHPYVKSPIDMACWDILGKVGIMINYISNYHSAHINISRPDSYLHCVPSGYFRFVVYLW